MRFGINHTHWDRRRPSLPTWKMEHNFLFSNPKQFHKVLNSCSISLSFSYLKKEFKEGYVWQKTVTWQRIQDDEFARMRRVACKVAVQWRFRTRNIPQWVIVVIDRNNQNTHRGRTRRRRATEHSEPSVCSHRPPTWTLPQSTRTLTFPRRNSLFASTKWTKQVEKTYLIQPTSPAWRKEGEERSLGRFWGLWKKTKQSTKVSWKNREVKKQTNHLGRQKDGLLRRRVDTPQRDQLAAANLMRRPIKSLLETVIERVGRHVSKVLQLKRELNRPWTNRSLTPNAAEYSALLSWSRSHRQPEGFHKASGSFRLSEKDLLQRYSPSNNGKMTHLSLTWEALGESGRG